MDKLCRVGNYQTRLFFLSDSSIHEHIVVATKVSI